MERLLIIGCGDIALRTIPLLTPHYRAFALVRNPVKYGVLHTLGVMPIKGDLDNRTSLARIAGLADIVLHFAPPPGSPPFAKSAHGIEERFDRFSFTDTRTRNLLAALSRGKLPKQMIYISTSGVYGNCDGAWVSESYPLNAQTPRAQRRADAEAQIRNWARRNRVNAGILRVPGIYAADRLPLSRLQQGMPCISDNEDSYTNHIHADDLAHITVAALQHAKPCRVYHASDDSHLKMGVYFDSVADAFGLPHVPRISRAEAQRILPESSLSFMSESRRLSNRRMKQELKVKLHYPTVADFLGTVQ